MLSSPSITVALWMINFNRQKIATQGLFINEKEKEQKVKIIAYSVHLWYCLSSADTFHINNSFVLSLKQHFKDILKMFSREPLLGGIVSLC